MIRSLAQLLTGSLLLWLLVAVPAWFFALDGVLLQSAIACTLCLAPMTATMIWCHYAFGSSPEQQLAAVMGGTSARLVVAVGGSIGLFFAVEELNRPAFLIWVVVFYLATLALEVVLIVRRQSALTNALAARTQQSRP